MKMRFGMLRMINQDQQHRRSVWIYLASGSLDVAVVITSLRTVFVVVRR